MMASVPINTGIEEPNAATTTRPNSFDGNQRIEKTAQSQSEGSAYSRCCEAQQQATACRNQRGDQGDADRIAGASENAREHVAAKVVDAEQMVAADAIERVGVLDGACIIGRDQRTSESHRQPEHYDRRWDPARN
jgi:hypothetical protein